jgi:hypothetical protein
MDNNEYILVEFVAKSEDADLLHEKLERYAKSGVLQIIHPNRKRYMKTDTNVTMTWVGITSASVKITPQDASILKLQDPFLAERMRISYISDEIKNKYRK